MEENILDELYPIVFHCSKFPEDQEPGYEIIKGLIDWLATCRPGDVFGVQCK